MRLVVIGCGNPLAGDDSAGLEILRRLQGCGNFGGELRQLSQAGVELLEIFDEADVIVFLDAVESGAPPGTIHWGPLPDSRLAPRALSSLSSHGWGLNEALGLARSLGRRVPQVWLLGVEGEAVSPAAERSAVVERAIDAAAEVFPRLLSLLTRGEIAWGEGPRQFQASNGILPEGLWSAEDLLTVWEAAKGDESPSARKDVAVQKPRRRG